MWVGKIRSLELFLVEEVYHKRQCYLAIKNDQFGLNIDSVIERNINK